MKVALGFLGSSAKATTLTPGALGAGGEGGILDSPQN
jgi:hypothetical protein